jgi:Bacteriophage Lambda NinG protein
MTLPQQSPKRKSEIASGKLKMRGTFVIKASELKAKLGSSLKDTPIGALVRASVKDQRKKAKAKAWKWFSEWIRLRDSDAYGRAQCITCQRSDHWRTMDAGHYITRAKESTLFDERNVSCQCKGCNRFQGGKFYEHGMAVDRKFGAGTRAALELKAGQITKRTVNDYLFLADTYKKRVELIKTNEPERYGRS